MKKGKLLLLIAIVFVMPLESLAQMNNIQITKFEMSNSLIASMNSVFDNNGDACAVIRFWYSGSGYIIEPNLGILKIETLPGETRLWVPKGTTRITVRHKEDRPLRGYNIPIKIESKRDYDAEITLTGETSKDPENYKTDYSAEITFTDDTSDDSEDSKTDDDAKSTISDDTTIESKNHVYIGAGYNIMSLSGLSLIVGTIFHHHQIELGYVNGMNTSDDLYFYDANDNLKAGYNYNAIRVSLTYGYEISVSNFFFITPMAGVSYLTYIGNEISNSKNNKDYQYANSLSATGGVRFSVGLGKHCRLYLTPEYQAAVYKNKNCKLISSYDENMKNWNDGFNLNVGFCVIF